MKFILTSAGMVQQVVSAVAQDPVSNAAGGAIGHAVVWGIQSFVTWFIHNGFPFAAELTLVWAMVCFLIAITGSGGWLERGAKSILASVLFAVAGWTLHA